MILKKGAHPVVKSKPQQKPDYINERIESLALKLLHTVVKNHNYLTKELLKQKMLSAYIKLQTEYGTFTICGDDENSYTVTFEKAMSNPEDEEFIEWEYINN